MKTKLSPEKIAAICASHGAGETYESLAKRFRCSQGTIANALKKGEKRRRTPDVSALKSTPETPPAPPTAEAQRADLAGQIAALRAEIGAAESPSLRASLNRILVTAQGLLLKSTPSTSDGVPEGYMLVKIDEIEGEGAKAAERKLDMIGKHYADLDFTSLPTCPACGGPIFPPSPKKGNH